MDAGAFAGRIGRPVRAIGLGLAVAAGAMVAGAAAFVLMVWSLFEVLMLPF